MHLANNKNHIPASEPPDYRLLPFFWGIFAAFPLISVIIQAARIFSSDKDPELRTKSLVLAVSLYLGGVNGTKWLQSDLAGYADMFAAAGHWKFSEYMLSLGRDPLFFVISYVGHYSLLGNFSLFIVFLTAFMYWQMLGAIGDALVKSELPRQFVVLVILAFAFLPDHFLWTAHTLRQMFALSLVVRFIVDFVFKEKFNAVAATSAVLIHSSVALFILFAFLSKITIRFFSSRTASFIAGSVLLAFYYFRIQIFTTFLNVVLQTSSGARFGGDIADDTLIVASKWLLPNVVLYTLACLSVLFLFSRNQTRNAKTISVLYLMYFVFMLFTYEAGTFTSLVSYRYLIDVYVFLPLILPFVMELLPKNNAFFPLKNLGVGMYSSVSYLFLLALFVGRFFYTLKNSNWHFSPTLDLLINPFFL